MHAFSKKEQIFPLPSLVPLHFQLFSSSLNASLFFLLLSLYSPLHMRQSAKTRGRREATHVDVEFIASLCCRLDIVGRVELEAHEKTIKDFACASDFLLNFGEIRVLNTDRKNIRAIEPLGSMSNPALTSPPFVISPPLRPSSFSDSRNESLQFHG